MKRALTLSAAALSLMAGAAHAQRFSVYEVFSGENCPPCALYNPGNWTLFSANTSKAMLLKYQVPIPSAGPLYNANMTDANARDAYYSISSAPSGVLNGGASANIANMTQAQIDAAYNVAPAFSMTVVHSYSSDYDSVFATINITALTAFTGTTMKLRTAYVATMEYPTAPGTNGEKEFHNVVQKMYPSATGTTIPNTWTSGQTQSYTISGPIQSFVDRSNHTFVAAWIQDDATKAVALGAKSAFVPMNLDASVTAVTSPSLTCATGTSANVATSLTLVNKGSTPLTTAKIYYRAGTGAYAVHTWNGPTLAMNASATVTLPAGSVPAGSALLVDSVALPNNAADLNPANNRWTGRAAVYNNTVNSLPISTGFENAGATPTGWLMYDANGNSNNWAVASSTQSNVGHNNSTYLIWHPNYSYTAGEVNYAIAPTPNVSASNDSIEFWVAYAQYQTEQDRLDVVYSTNCGQTWTSFWNKAGSALATAPATTNNFVPTQSQWRKEVVSLSTVPANAMVAFKATSDYGNNVFVDDVTLRVGAATGVAEVVAGAAVQLSPNPARESATLEFTLGVSNNVRVDVVDMAGRTVQAGADMKLAAGAQKVTINTATLPAGLYMVRLQTEQGAINERLTVVK